MKQEKGVRPLNSIPSKEDIQERLKTLSKVLDDPTVLNKYHQELTQMKQEPTIPLYTDGVDSADKERRKLQKKLKGFK